VFKAKGFKSWNGTSNGGKIPIGTYYYVIELRSQLGFGKISGWLLIL
jgi:hypothetical protein